MFSIASIRQRGGTVHASAPLQEQLQGDIHDHITLPAVFQSKDQTPLQRAPLPSLTSLLHAQMARLSMLQRPIIAPETLIPPNMHSTAMNLQLQRALLLQQSRDASDKTPVDTRERTLRRRDERAARQAKGLAKPPNSFILFRRDCAEQLRSRCEREGLELTDMSRMIAGLWNQATQEVKSAYQLRASILRDAYNKMHSRKYKNQQSDKRNVSRMLDDVVSEVSGSSTSSPWQCASQSGSESSGPSLPRINDMVPFAFNC
ncbi:hypothetical protein BC830DRAFT_1116779 [Chytriomyces sp. MP71]|nr:hypothetical protein BC830DRAFT_1116779 [Chytriomyces sp. MP71]